MNRVASSILGVTLLCALVGSGCSKSSESPAYVVNKNRPLDHVEGVDAKDKDNGKRDDSASATTFYTRSPETNGVAQVRGGGGNEDGGSKRKIILTGDIRVKIADFGKAEQELQRLIQEHKGLIAHAEVAGSVGGLRHGVWKVRLPPAEIAEFSEAVKKLGELILYSSEGREVTEEYYDLQMRLKSKEAELESLVKIFDKGSGKIEDVLAVQREVNRAQGELEQMKGRQRLLDNLVELTTVTVRLEERDTFTPATPLPPVPFGTSISQTFAGSVDALVAVGKALVLIAVAAGPWVPVMLVPAALVWLTWRRRKNGSAQGSTTPAGLTGG